MLVVVFVFVIVVGRMDERWGLEEDEGASPILPCLGKGTGLGLGWEWEDGRGSVAAGMGLWAVGCGVCVGFVVVGCEE